MESAIFIIYGRFFVIWRDLHSPNNKIPPGISLILCSFYIIDVTSFTLWAFANYYVDKAGSLTYKRVTVFKWVPSRKSNFECRMVFFSQVCEKVDFFPQRVSKMLLLVFLILGMYANFQQKYSSVTSYRILAIM